MEVDRAYWATIGPLGLPCTDAQAFALEERLKKTSELHDDVGRLVIEKATIDLLPGERADVSWITTQDVDRMREIVLAKGMDDSHFALNPLVTLQHCYALPPVGRSEWRRRVTEGDMVGIKAKTVYPARPESWTAAEVWPPDFAFPLVQSGLLSGKSIGFLPVKARWVTDEERQKRPELAGVRRIIEEWLLLEYACCYLPAQQQAVVEAVGKGLVVPELIQKAWGIEEILKAGPAVLPPAVLPAHLAPPAPPASPPVIPFVALSEVERAVQARLAALDVESLAKKVVQSSFDRARGRV